MGDEKPSYEELKARLAEAESTPRAIRDEKIDALIGKKEGYLLHLKEMEEAHRESETKYRELVQNANSAIIRWKRDGTITFFNEYAQACFGYGADEVIGKHVNIIVPETESTGKDLTTLALDVADHPERYVNTIKENVCRDGRRIMVVNPGYLKEHDIPIDNEEASKLREGGKTVVYVLADKAPIGALALADIIREESRQAVFRLTEAGIQVMMLGGFEARRGIRRQRAGVGRLFCRGASR